ncbi:hypothetical protein R1flu_014605 [Riccia fluitans]|uniref:EF-hand domain-containing protein n=1 Tax=Riccia fluitans TaxID=41844 RepID=A0ABD1YJX8_9MARC
MKFRNIFHRKEKSSASAKASTSNPDSEVSPDKSSSGHSNNSSCSSKHSNCSGHHRAFTDWRLEDENQKLTEAFQIIDKNGDGKISHEELKAMWAKLGEKVTEQELRAMVQEVDANGDGEIELDEFITLNRNFGLGLDDAEHHSEEVHLAFNLADVNRDGRISVDELQGVMKKLGMKITAAESCAMLTFADSDHDCLLNYEEFERLMKSNVFASSTH